MSKKSPSASPEFSVREFFQRFPDDDACLAHIMQVRFGGTRFECGSCGKESTHHKLATRRTFVCANCGHHVNPTAGTILHDTRTPLVSWFYAMYLFCTTRHGVSGKELQRQLGVTYKTAYRIGQQIRDLTAKAQSFDALLAGHVELDEAYVGGRKSGGKRGRGAPGKTIVMGLISRDGPMKAVVIPNVKKETLRGVVLDNVEPGSVVSTDELYSYNLLTGDGFEHGRVSHGKGEYAVYDYRSGNTFHVNTVEGFWRLFKASIRSTHVQISAKHMQRYLSEFTFRANHRQRVNGMFDLLVGAL
ncbi:MULTISPECIES: IS1595 family transposase [Sphingobium]|jgi:transposase|uniref:IS1595 family transposase n=1 Tax=Sphingobium TaxID=165695 RepID=UPI000C572FE4|nr:MULTISPECIES: IS1595 family transposase [Sphingobium]MBS46995.1 IS1595 family transposase [Sphingobium sp.]MCC4258900.1 IS1595 family transposase [Sphingobium lactosutens]HCW60518.1 IS1595 family transposase [Sphingobium sp.]|tara:strand:- start:1273 stop:2178 length:906 start_codon:yes stop_codon:yes gene_type:complete